MNTTNTQNRLENPLKKNFFEQVVDKFIRLSALGETMAVRGDGGPSTPYNQTLRCIAVGRRRTVLRTVLKRRDPVEEKYLLRGTIAHEPGVAASEPEDTWKLYLELIHVHLPMLESTGLISWDRSRGTVEKTAHPALNDSRFEQILEVDSDNLDEVLAAVAHEHRRIALTHLKQAQEPLSIPELSDVIVDELPASTDLEAVSTSLYHAHLPKLAQSDLVEFDVETGLSTYASHPTLEEVFTIIFEPDEYLVDKFDGFLNGLRDTFTKAGPGDPQTSGWPHHWRETHNG